MYKYRGKKYTFDRDRVNWLQDQVRQYIDDGSKVYVILLLGKDAKGQAGKMSYGGGKYSLPLRQHQQQDAVPGKHL